jgi:hypothetical protein
VVSAETPVAVGVLVKEAVMAPVAPVANEMETGAAVAVAVVRLWLRDRGKESRENEVDGEVGG